MQQAVKYSSISSYMLKYPSLLTQVIKYNKKAQEKLLKHMCNFGSPEEWGSERRAVSYYIYVETGKYQYHLLNPTPLECVVDYIMVDAVGDRALKKMHQLRLKLIDGSI